MVGYSDLDLKGNSYFVFFVHRNKLNNPKTKQK